MSHPAPNPNWDFSGMREQAQYIQTLGRSIGNAEAMPAWKAGDPFGRVKR